MSKSVSKRIGLVSIALIVFAVVLMALGSAAFAGTGDHSAVVGSLHDIGVGDNPCESCHLPHHGGDAFLWDGNPNSPGGGSSVAAGVSTAIKPLCYSCHDGTATHLQELVEVMKKDHIRVVVKLGQGTKGYRVFSSDLTLDYVKINAHYTT